MDWNGKIVVPIVGQIGKLSLTESFFRILSFLAIFIRFQVTKNESGN